jgi:hypothetical protein
MMTMKADGRTGRTAIFSGADNGPLENPHAHASRIRFHSDWWMPSVYKRNVSVTLPGMTVNTSRAAVTNLFAHGRSGTPVVTGFATVAGINVPLAGSVNVQQNGSGVMRLITLGADAGYVTITERSLCAKAGDWPAVTVAITVFVTDALIDGSQDTRPNDPVAIHWTPTLFSCGYGRCRSDRRYLRAAPAGSEFAFALNRTWDIGVQTSKNTLSPTLRSAVNGYVRQTIYADDGVASTPGSFTTSVQPVTI